MKSRQKVTKIFSPTDRSLESHNKIPQHPKSKSHKIDMAFSFGPVSRSRSFGRGHEIGEAEARAVALHRLLTGTQNDGGIVLGEVQSFTNLNLAAFWG